jgi:two-component system chemotaxis response regulator CheB
MSRIRVLVVDDSVVVRRLVTEVLSEDPGIEVIGTASNGKLGVAKVDQLKPDLVTLDIEMPEMNGLEALREIRKRHPRLPVIMFSTLTQAGASATLDALASGASDYVTKPANVGSITQGMQAIREELTPKVHALCKRGLGQPGAARQPLAPIRPIGTRGATTAPTGAGPGAPAALGAKRQPLGRTGLTSFTRTPAAPAPVNRPASRSGRVDLLVIGSSTGGPNALATVFAQLPKDLGVPILITQHMPPMFTTLFAERLTKINTIPVTEATDGLILKPNQAFLAPGDHHLVLDPNAPQGRIRITRDAPVNSCRPAVDPMFQSAVKVFGGNILAVILTGMGSDGLDGCRAVVEAGGQVVTQDEQTSVVWGMPGHVTQAGLSDAVLPLERIAGEISQRVGKSRLVGAGATRRIG